MANLIFFYQTSTIFDFFLKKVKKTKNTSNKTLSLYSYKELK